MGFLGESQGLPEGGQQPTGQFPILQHFQNNGGMFGPLAMFLMHGMQNRQAQSGLSPEDFQAKINTGLDRWRGNHPDLVGSILPQPQPSTQQPTTNFLGRLGGR